MTNCGGAMMRCKYRRRVIASWRRPWSSVSRSRCRRSTVPVASSITPTDVNEIIRGVCNVTRNLTEGRVEVVLQLSPLPPLVCNGAALGQVFYNLLINAVQAMAGRTDARVRISSVARDEGVEVTVADNGPGISAEVLPRIFEPFFTTKEVGKGTGLGLTVCTDLIESHHGRLTVKSATGAGAEFSVYLPFGG